MIGHQLGHYQIVEALGRGGMGEVYRALDTSLDRQVALKVLPTHVESDATGLQRFLLEAKTLASLNHPNIAAIHGIEHAEGRRFLVLEMVEGETLERRLARGPLEIDEVLDIAGQVAEALEAAHRNGVIHRDLKPGNIMLDRDGRVKVLDFGLAKVLDRPKPTAADDVTDVAALTRATQIVGTASYMSPEQARGKPLDERTDIWAFGCVLYEMVTGKQAFGGETISDTIAAILEREPDWEAVPQTIPAGVQVLLGRCLQKDGRHRLRSIGDAWVEIAEARQLSSSFSGVVPRTIRGTAGKGWLRRWLPWILAGAASLVAVASLVGAWRLRQGASGLVSPVSRLEIRLPPSQELAFGYMATPGLALSPSGSHVVYAARPRGATDPEETRLYLRPLDALTATPIRGTEGGYLPFFSPDGLWLGFFAEGKLKKVALSGGAPIPLADAAYGWGGSWGPDDTIVFTPNTSSGLWRVAADGTGLEQLTTLALAQGEQEHDWPHVLPDGESVLFTVWTGGSFADSRIAVHSVEGGRRRVLVEGGSNAYYAPTGHLVYARAGELLAIPFDPESLAVRGAPTSVLDGMLAEPDFHTPQFAISRNGMLVYAPGAPLPSESTLLWVDRQGQATPLARADQPVDIVRLSADGRRVLYNTYGDAYDIGVYELELDRFRRLIADPFYVDAPVWSPDGTRVAFTSAAAGVMNLYSRQVDGSEPAEPLLPAEYPRWPTSWSSGGDWLAYYERHPTTGLDIWVLRLDGSGSRRPLVRTAADERQPAFSPGDRWLAYQSDESGRDEVYVRTFPDDGRRWQVSLEGGEWPIWSADGRELFYRNGDQVMAVTVPTGDDFGGPSPRRLFEMPGFRVFDVAADGERFLGVRIEPLPSITVFVVVQNWFAELAGAVPAR